MSTPFIDTLLFENERSVMSPMGLAQLVVAQIEFSVHPDWTYIESKPADLVLLSCDSIGFYVHGERLLSASKNAFNDLLHQTDLPTICPNHPKDSLRTHQPFCLKVPNDHRVLNAVLHIIYGTIEDQRAACALLSLSEISLVLDGCKSYGIPLLPAFSQLSTLCDAVVAYCSCSPLLVYALAAAHSPELHHIAVHSSTYLININLMTITDEVASQMGAVYLNQLFLLHLRRTEAFKRLVIPAPTPHTPTPVCGSSPLHELWTRGTAFFSWIASSGVEDGMIMGVICSLMKEVYCQACKNAMLQRGQQLLHDWSLVPVSLLGLCKRTNFNT